MQQRKTLSVVILGWNGKQYLEQFLPSIVQYSSHPEYEVVYADNCSTDDSVSYVQQHFPTVRIVQNSSNNGYAGGYNEALKQVDAKYYVLLNQDVEVTENWIAPVLELMERNPEAGAASPKLRAYDTRTHFEYAGAAGGLMDKLGYAFCRGRIFDSIEMDEGQYDDEREIFWASGACMFVRAETFHLLEGLDEAFFAHQEEIDLCWRMKNRGYSIHYTPASTVYHVGGGSLPQGSPRKVYLNFRNNLFMLFKNLPFTQVLFKIPFRIVLDIVAGFYGWYSNGNFTDLREIVRAHLHFYRAIPMLIQKRNCIKCKSSKDMYLGSVVFQYFILKRRTFKEMRQSGDRQ